LHAKQRVFLRARGANHSSLIRASPENFSKIFDDRRGIKRDFLNRGVHHGFFFSMFCGAKMSDGRHWARVLGVRHAPLSPPWRAPRRVLPPARRTARRALLRKLRGLHAEILETP
jgi:hypothetical protein